MRATRCTTAVIVIALAGGTAGTLVTSVAGAGAASRHGSAPRTHHGGMSAGSSAADLTRARITRAGIGAAAGQRAPFVGGAAGPRRSKRGLGPPPMSRAMLRAAAVKQARARTWIRHANPPVARDLAATQQAQIRNYYCGPATVSEMLAQVNVRMSQLAAAKALGTHRSGTAWSNSRGYPVARALNAHQRRAKYVATGLPWTPTRRQILVFRMDLVHDIGRGRGVPLAGAAYEVPGGPHLVGHPAGQTILHWFDIRGYSQSGAVTDYEDSVHGAPAIAWAAGVPAYSSLPTVTVADILGARGYIW